MDIRDSFLTLASISLIGGVIGLGLRYSLNIIIARGIGAEGLGVFAFGLVVMKAGSVLARLGLDVAAKKYIPLYGRENPQLLSGVVAISLVTPLVIGLIIALILYLLSNVLESLLGGISGAVQILLLGLPFFALLMTSVGIFRGFKLPEYAVYTRDIGQSGIAVVAVGTASFLFRDVWHASLAYVLSLIIAAIFSVIAIVKITGARNFLDAKFKTKELLLFSTSLLGIALIQYIMSWTDILLLGFLTSASETGQYQAAFQTSVLLLLVIQAANSIFPPIVSELYAARDWPELEEIFIAVTKWVTYFTALGLGFLTIFSNPILGLFGPEFATARRAMIILCIGQFFTASTGPVGVMLTMSDHERLDLVNTIMVSILNVVLNIIFISRYGAFGAAIATATSLGLLNILRLLEVRVILSIQPYTNSYVSGMIGVIISSFVMYVTSYLLPEHLFSAILGGLFGLSVFALWILLTGLDQNDRVLIESVQRV